ncbi:hypothetical protein BDV3_003224 [Batrachochytrium dendrobatidis]|uniref:Uncharacterized protein n=1 Tax=Batrachochytrium dendrobatidis (strain JEL423) TaxID=403673 RepID=A0A177X0V9_BATDL|nr:hypothetical protein BDEG_28450 [Batrachochytrium dendrobatidis JEL423]
MSCLDSTVTSGIPASPPPETSLFIPCSITEKCSIEPAFNLVSSPLSNTTQKYTVLPSPTSSPIMTVVSDATQESKDISSLIILPAAELVQTHSSLEVLDASPCSLVPASPVSPVHPSSSTCSNNSVSFIALNAPADEIQDSSVQLSPAVSRRIVVTFNPLVAVAQTFHKDDYDRSSISVAPLLRQDIIELLTYRAEMLHVTRQLTAYRDQLIMEKQRMYFMKLQQQQHQVMQQQLQQAWWMQQQQQQQRHFQMHPSQPMYNQTPMLDFIPTRNLSSTNNQDMFEAFNPTIDTLQYRPPHTISPIYMSDPHYNQMFKDNSSVVPPFSLSGSSTYYN